MDMIQFEVHAVEICIALYEGSDAIIVLGKSLSSNINISRGWDSHLDQFQIRSYPMHNVDQAA